MQGRDIPAVTTGLERIAAKARCEGKLAFTSLAHHISKDLLWRNLCQIRGTSAVGVDGQSVEVAKESFGNWVEDMLASVHRKAYKAPPVRRVFIPKPGRTEKRPSAFRASRIGRYSAARLKFCRVSTNRTSCRARLAAGRGLGRITPCRRSTRSSPGEKSVGCWSAISRTSLAVWIIIGSYVSLNTA